MANLEQQLSAAVETYKEEHIELLADLARCPGTLGNELPAQERLLTRVLSMGLDAELWELDPAILQADPRFVPLDRGYTNRPNPTAILHPPGRGGRSLVLNGHIDVVNPEPIE